MNCIAAYDFGTSGVKAVLVSKDGDILAIREKSYSLLKPRPLYVEQKPEDFWEAVCAVTHGVLEDAKLEPEAVKGLSFSVQSLTLIPVSAEGEVLHNAISWLDGRAEKQAEKINQRCGAELVRSQDYQARILWFIENKPEIYDKTAYFLDCDGFLQYKATGIMAASQDYDGILKYPTAIQKYMDITLADCDVDKLPPMVQACKLYGPLNAKGARELGLAPGTPVFGGMIDVAAAAAGCGCIKNADAHLYLGSSGWLSVLIDKPCETSEGAYQIMSINPHFLRAVMESLCFSMKGQIETYKKDTEGQISEVGVNGGGALSGQWMQMMADILQIPVHVPAETRHSGAIGAAFAAAVGLGWRQIEGIDDFITVKKTYMPDEKLADLYDKKYEHYQKLYVTVKDLYRELNEEQRNENR